MTPVSFGDQTKSDEAVTQAEVASLKFDIFVEVLRGPKISGVFFKYSMQFIG